MSYRAAVKGMPFCMKKLAHLEEVAKMSASALVAAEDKCEEDRAFLNAKAGTASFYADHALCRAPGLRHSNVEGHAAVDEMAPEAC